MGKKVSAKFMEHKSGKHNRKIYGKVFVEKKYIYIKSNKLEHTQTVMGGMNSDSV